MTDTHLLVSHNKLATIRLPRRRRRGDTTWLQYGLSIIRCRDAEQWIASADLQTAFNWFREHRRTVYFSFHFFFLFPVPPPLPFLHVHGRTRQSEFAPPPPEKKRRKRVIVIDAYACSTVKYLESSSRSWAASVSSLLLSLNKFCFCSSS